VLTPRGTISRYFNGVGLDGNEMALALADASGNRIESVTTRLALLCAHFDPRQGLHSAAVMNATRVVSLLLVVALGGWIWRHRRGGTR
jgi:protein SCO1/2